MCGIVGYVGPGRPPISASTGSGGWSTAGYDSAGIAVVNGDGLKIQKAAGKLSALEQELEPRCPSGTLGIGHTRWATHGAPTTPNAHPHTDQSGRIAVIHNGIIENSAAIRKALREAGPHLQVRNRHRGAGPPDRASTTTGNLEEAVAAALRDVDGAYGIAVISADEPDVAGRGPEGLAAAGGRGRGRVLRRLGRLADPGAHPLAWSTWTTARWWCSPATATGCAT